MIIPIEPVRSSGSDGGLRAASYQTRDKSGNRSAVWGRAAACARNASSRTIA